MLRHENIDLIENYVMENDPIGKNLILAHLYNVPSFQVSDSPSDLVHGGAQPNTHRAHASFPQTLV